MPKTPAQKAANTRKRNGMTRIQVRTLLARIARILVRVFGDRAIAELESAIADLKDDGKLNGSAS